MTDPQAQQPPESDDEPLELADEPMSANLLAATAVTADRSVAEVGFDPLTQVKIKCGSCGSTQTVRTITPEAAAAEAQLDGPFRRESAANEKATVLAYACLATAIMVVTINIILPDSFIFGGLLFLAFAFTIVMGMRAVGNFEVDNKYRTVLAGAGAGAAVSAALGLFG